MTDSSPILDRRLTDTLATLHQNFTETSPILGLFHDKRYKPLISGACRLRQRIPSNVFIMGYVTLSLGCCMVCCCNCFISGRLVYLYAFASYDHPSALKIKYAMIRDCQFLLEVVLWIYEHSLDCFVALLYFLHLQVLIPSMYHSYQFY